MTPIEFQNRKNPEYYDTMFLDGYTPQQIFAAFHKTMINRLLERQPEEEYSVKINTETRITK